MQQLLLDLLPDQKPTLRHFFPGENVELLDALTHWLDAKPCAYPANLFVIWGPHGSGKSFLCNALATAGFSTLPLAHELLPDHPSGWVLDNAHQLNPAEQQHLFRHLVHLTGSCTRLFVTLNLPPDAQNILREDVRTRLGAGHIFQLKPLSESDQRTILAEHASHRGWELTPEVLDYLYQRAPRDLCSLTKLIERLDQLSLEFKRRITLPLLRTALHESITPTGILR